MITLVSTLIVEDSEEVNYDSQLKRKQILTEIKIQKSKKNQKQDLNNIKLSKSDSEESYAFEEVNLNIDKV